MTKRIALSLVIIFALIAPALAQNRFAGTVRVAFGHVRDRDGSWRSIAGLELPYVAERITATPLHVIPGQAKIPPSNGFHPPVTSTVYKADAGDGYGVVDGDDPSSVDDIVMQGGAGLPWQNLTFGIEINLQHSFLIRWRGRNSYVTGRGPGVGAFDNEFADFGVIYPATSPGTYKITISVAAAGVVSPSDTVFLAQQFRTTQPDGEGAFDLAMNNVYNSSADVNIGHSDNVFWYDFDPLNGIYAEDEIDNFGDTLFANLLTTITISGSQDTLVPFTFSMIHGTQVSGDVTSFWYSDDDKFVALPSYAGSRADVPLQVVVEGISPTSTVNSLTFTVESSATQAGGTQSVQLFNYTTSAWDTIDTRALGATDATMSITLTNLPSKYINSSTRHLKAQISITPGSGGSRGYQAKIDRAAWITTHG